MKYIGVLVKVGALIYAVICILSTLVLPTWLNVAVDNLFFPLALVHCLIVFFKRRELRVLFGLFFLLTLVGLLSDLVNSHGINIGHFLTILLLLKIPVIISAFLENDLLKQWNNRRNSWIDALFLVVVGLNLLMVVNPFGIGYSLQEFYVPKSTINFVYYHEWGTFRLSGIYTNPNNNALMFACFLLYYYFLRKETSWYFISLALAMIALTQSRTVFIFLILLGAITWISKFDRAWLKKSIGWLLLAFVGLAGFIYSSSNLRSLFSFDAFTSNSFLTRIKNAEAFGNGKENKWIGSGIIEDPFNSLGFYFDSEFVATAFQFGLIGLLLIICLFIYNLWAPHLVGMKGIWRSTFILILVASFTNMTFLNSQVSVVFGCLLGLILLKIKESTMPTNNPLRAPR